MKKFTWGKYKNLSREIVCKHCKKSFIVDPCRLKTAKFCSMECRNKAYVGRIFHTAPKINKKCEVCEKEFSVPPSSKSRKFCCRKCQYIGQDRSKTSGKNHWNWNGGTTPAIDKLRKSTSQKKWAEDIKKIWDYTCQICGIRGLILNSNHIRRFAKYPDQRKDIINGICLCQSCHMTIVNRHELEWESYFDFCWTTKLMEQKNYDLYTA